MQKENSGKLKEIVGKINSLKEEIKKLPHTGERDSLSWLDSAVEHLLREETGLYCFVEGFSNLLGEKEKIRLIGDEYISLDLGCELKGYKESINITVQMSLAGQRIHITGPNAFLEFTLVGFRGVAKDKGWVEGQGWILKEGGKKI